VPGTPKYAKARDEFIAERLDRKVKKPEPVLEEAPPPPPPVEEAIRGRGVR